MPIIPEKLSSRHSSRSAIASQFWECAEHSTRYIDGQVWELPCEPPALNLTGSSGLSRSQQLIAAQSMGVPMFPSYDGNSGGLVVDRVLANVGGRRWWTALSGRLKAQRMYTTATRDGAKIKALRDLSSYALCARTRIQLTNRITLNGVLEAPDALFLRDEFRRLTNSSSETSDNPENAAAVPAASSTAESLAAHAVLRAALPGHDLTAVVGRNMDYVESSGDYARVPLAVSLDLSSLDRSDGLQYRVGLHQVTAPPMETQPSSISAGKILDGNATGRGNISGANNNGNAGADGTGGRNPLTGTRHMRTVLHAQGAVAVEGEAYVWRGGSASEKAGSPAGGSAMGSLAQGGAAIDRTNSVTSGISVADKEGKAVGVGKNSNATAAGEGDGERDEARPPGRVSEALATAAAADSGEFKEEGTSLHETMKQIKSASKNGAVVGDTATEHREDGTGHAGTAFDASAGELRASSGSTSITVNDTSSTSSKSPSSSASATTTDDVASTSASASLENFVSPLERLGDALHAATHRNDSQDLIQSESSQSPARLIPVTSDSISTAIADSLAALRQLKETVSRVTGEVQDGSLQRLSEQLSMKQSPRRRPYSLLLAQPHVKINAAMGCLARMPLPPFRAFIPGGGANASSEHLPAVGSITNASANPIAATATATGSSISSSLHRRTTSVSSMASRTSLSSQLAEVWEPYLKGTALRVFASAGISGQIGRFTRPFLDYTAAAVRLDVGLSSPHVVGTVPAAAVVSSALDEASRPDKHRAFALEGRGSWHALSVSLAQQVVGPVRVRSDFRFALDPTNVPQDQGERSTLKGLAQTALSMRPSLLEAVYGADMVLPGTEGAARVAVWWSPKRREAMAELRMF